MFAFTMNKNKTQIFLLVAVLVQLLSFTLFMTKTREAHLGASYQSQLNLLAFLGFAISGALLFLASRSLLNQFVIPVDIAKSKLLSVIPSADLSQMNVNPSRVSIDELSQKVVEQLEISQQGQWLIADYASDVLCCLTEQRKFTELNLQAEEILGYSEGSLLATPLETIVIEEYRKGLIEYFDRCKNAPSESAPPFECQVMRTNGTVVDLRWHCEWSNALRCFFCVAKDITARKENERLKAEISAMVTHDLRTPITGFRFLLENFRSGNLGVLSAEALSQINQADASISQVLLLINQLLDAEKIEGNQMKLDCSLIAVSELYSQSRSMVAGLAEKRKIELRFPSSENLINADFERTKQILCNLLSNAIKWSPDGGQVVVEEEVRAGTLLISVRDNGPGIAKSKQALLFERFKSLDGRIDKEMASSGLGLYLCKKLVELQSGSIGVKSDLGKGSSFWFALPIASEDDLIEVD